MKRSNRHRARNLQPRKRNDSYYLAGLHLLADSDFENVSIARIVKEAGGSVGSFYYHYRDKLAYLRDSIWRTFRGLESGLDRRYSGEGTTIIGGVTFSEFIADVVSQLSSKEIAGVIRATLKLGLTDENALQPYAAYRLRVCDWAEALFASNKKRGDSRKRLREGMQLLFAMIADSILVPKSAALKLGDKRFAGILSEIISTHSGVSKTLRISPSPSRKPHERRIGEELGSAPERIKAPESKSGPKPQRKKSIQKTNRRKVTLL